MGVSSADDRDVMLTMVDDDADSLSTLSHSLSHSHPQISRLPGAVSSAMHIVQFSPQRPAYLPFHLLVWGQKLARDINCVKFNHRTYPHYDQYAELFGGCRAKGAVRRMPPSPAIDVLFESAANYSDTITKPLRYMYYTECDQIVKFDAFSTLRAISSVLNDTSFIVGRRKIKDIASSPGDYRDALSLQRICHCREGFRFQWPLQGQEKPTIQQYL